MSKIQCFLSKSKLHANLYVSCPYIIVACLVTNLAHACVNLYVGMILVAEMTEKYIFMKSKSNFAEFP